VRGVVVTGDDVLQTGSEAALACGRDEFVEALVDERAGPLVGPAEVPRVRGGVEDDHRGPEVGGEVHPGDELLDDALPDRRERRPGVGRERQVDDDTDARLVERRAHLPVAVLDSLAGVRTVEQEFDEVEPLGGGPRGGLLEVHVQPHGEPEVEVPPGEGGRTVGAHGPVGT